MHTGAKEMHLSRHFAVSTRRSNTEQKEASYSVSVLRRSIHLDVGRWRLFSPAPYNMLGGGGGGES